MFTAMLVSMMVRLQDGLRPEDLGLEAVASESAGDRSVRVRARTALPDGAPWGRDLLIQAEARRVTYRLLFRDDVFAHPWEPGEGRPVAVCGEIDGRGDVEIVIEFPAPGPYRVTLSMDPTVQRASGALGRLRETLRLRSHDGVPRLDLGDATVWVGDPGRVLGNLASDAAEYLEILARARQVLDDAQAAAEANPTADWDEGSRPFLDALAAQLARIEERERTSLLWASWNFLKTVYADVRTAAQTMPGRLEEERRRGNDGDPGETWGSELDAYDGKEDVVEGPVPVLAEAYRGGLTLGRMRLLLDLAPLFAAREALLWHARYAERGVDEIAGGRPDTIRAWREVADEAPRTIGALGESLERAARRDRDWFADRGWNRYFTDIPALFDDPVDGGLRQVAEQALQPHGDGFPVALERLRAASQAAEEAIRGALPAP